MEDKRSDRQLLLDLIGTQVHSLADAQLAELLEADDDQLAQFGLPRSARRRVLACAEMARRYQPRALAPEPISGPAQALAHLGALRSRDRETLVVLLLDGRHCVIGVELVAMGAVAHVSVEAREVFAPAISAMASAIVIAHNHPSGNTFPSRLDAEFTHSMVEAGRVLKIDVIDHLIVARRSYYSFQKSGIL